MLVRNSYHFQRPENMREFLAVVLGWGILTSEGESHKIQRRNLLPAFSFRHIKDLYPLFWQRSCEAIDAMTSKCTGHELETEIEVYSWASRTALDIIGATAAGVEFESVKKGDSPLTRTYKQLEPDPQDETMIFLRAIVPGFIYRRLPLRRIRQISDASKHLRSVCQDIVRDKTTRVANKQDAGLDIMTVALKSKLFSEENLIDQMLTFISAGHDTTASSLVWATWLLSKHPDVQERLRNEIRDNLPSPQADATIDSVDIDKLHYLTAVCSEVLRVRSPVTFIPRVSVVDTTIDGCFVPRGTHIVCPVWAMNRDSCSWGQDSYDFKPERWLSPETGTYSEANAYKGGMATNYAFMTFGHGPRGCIGKSFAKAELACLLATWVGRFSFTVKDKSLLDERNLEVNYSVVTRPKGGLELLVTAVDGW